MVIRFEDLQRILNCDFICEVNEQKVFNNDKDLDTYKNFSVVEIRTEGENLIIKLEANHKPITRYDVNDKWVSEYIKQFGKEPSFF